MDPEPRPGPPVPTSASSQKNLVSGKSPSHQSREPELLIWLLQGPDLPGPLVPSYQGVKDLMRLVLLLPVVAWVSLSPGLEFKCPSVCPETQPLGAYLPLRHREGRRVGREPAPLGVNAELDTGGP